MNASIESDGSRGRFRSAPHRSLRTFVVEYWGLARDLAAMGGFTITPDCFGELICCVDDLYVVEDGGRRKLPRCFLIGLLDGPMRIESEGLVRCMAARLRAWSLGRIFASARGGPGHCWRDAGDFFGHREAQVMGMVERCDWRSLVSIYDRLLMDRYGGWRSGMTGVDIAERFISDGPCPTAAIARERGLTHRQVERQVRTLTRTSPKQLACLSRFQRVRDAIWADPAIDLVRLAIDAGYSDQPHTTRHFERFSGQTPGQFIRNSIAKKKWPATQDVAFVQEPPGGDG